MAAKTAPPARREKSVPASEFCKSFGRFREEATAGKIVKVTSHGRVVGAYISAADLERFETLERRQRQVYAIEDLPDELFDLIVNAEYGKTPE